MRILRKLLVLEEQRFYFLEFTLSSQPQFLHRRTFRVVLGALLRRFGLRNFVAPLLLKLLVLALDVRVHDLEKRLPMIARYGLFASKLFIDLLLFFLADRTRI